MENNQDLNNPLLQLARLYKAIEENLRRCSASETLTPITMQELIARHDVQSSMKSPDQVRHAVKTLLDKGFVIKVGAFTNAKYYWNPKAAPFTLETKTSQRAAKAPSEVKITKAAPREIELAFDGVIIVVGKNPATGRIRVVIE